MKALAEQGDLTSALIRGLQFKAEEEYRATPRPIRSVGLLPNKTCGIFLTAALTTHFVHDREISVPIERIPISPGWQVVKLK